MLRAVWVVLWAGVLTFVYASRVLLNYVLRRADAVCRCEELARTWGRHVIRAAGSTVSMEGLEHLHPEAPQILVANHTSWFDVFALVGYLPVSFRFVAKKELAKIPIFGQAWVTCGHISIDRSDRAAAIASLAQAGERIRRDGLTIVMFPEGTRSSDGELQRFKKGAFVLALQAGVPIVPVGIIGTGKVQPKGSFRVSPGHIRIRIGEAINAEDVQSMDRDELLARAHRDVSRLMRDGPLTSAAAPGEEVEAEVERSSGGNSGPAEG